jgi:hypothetical protein
MTRATTFVTCVPFVNSNLSADRSQRLSRVSRRTDTQPRSLPPCGDSYLRTPMCLILCSSREPKQLLRHLTKRSHRCQRVHIVPPLHDLSVLDGNDRDEPVVV